MGSYSIFLKHSVEKDLRRISRDQLPRIMEAIAKLSDEPRPACSRNLVGARQTYRMRVGDYRVLYIVDDSAHIVEVQKVGHRREVYR